jgi:hypothetical protein
MLVNIGWRGRWKTEAILWTERPTGTVMGAGSLWSGARGKVEVRRACWYTQEVPPLMNVRTFHFYPSRISTSSICAPSIENHSYEPTTEGSTFSVPSVENPIYDSFIDELQLKVLQ